MIGIIGGSGVYEITHKADSCTKKLVKTDYGDVSFPAMLQVIIFHLIKSISELTSMH